MLKWTFSYIALSGYRRNVWKFNVPIQNTQFNNCTIHPHCISSNLQWTTRYLFKNAIHRNRMGSDSTKNSRALTVPKLHRKNVGLAHPKDSGSDFFNYKSFFSTVLLALVGYDYKFIYLEVECQGRISDGGVYRNSSLCKVVVFIVTHHYANFIYRHSNFTKTSTTPTVAWKSPFKWQWNQKNSICICSRWCFPPYGQLYETICNKKFRWPKKNFQLPFVTYLTCYRKCFWDFSI